MNKPIYILGISAFYHDSAACLVRGGDIVAAAQEERFTRKKHDASFPTQAIAFCLKEANITLKDVTYIGFYDKPFIKFERILFTYLAYAPFGLFSFLKAIPLWIKEKIFLKDLIRSQLGFEGEIIFTEHHESHAASAFYPSPFQEAAILTIDGVGEWATASLAKGKNNKLDVSHEIKFPHSLGLLYSAFTYYVGFRVNSGEYKLMGLAPYGQPKYAELIKENLVDIKDDGSLKLNMEYFDYCAGLTMVNKKFCKLFGGLPRTPESAFSQKDMDIAASIQLVTEEIMLKMADHLYELTKLDNLCLAGGVALNCVGNGKILREGKFKNIWIQPAAGDAGGALGVALFIWYQYLNNERRADGVHDSQKGTLLGPDYDKEAEGFAREKNIPFEKLSDQELAERIAGLLNQGHIIGLCHGRMEFGPRALGCRSIIADARSEKIQSELNLKIKFRESFRPFAPSVLKEKVKEYFDLDQESPYMLLVAPVARKQILESASRRDVSGFEKLKIKRSSIPAVTHIDFSARVQTVSPETNPFYYSIIAEFEKLTNCPVIVNTSFNVRGEPIVHTPQDAYRCFMSTNMDHLVVGNCLFDKRTQPGQDHYKKHPITLELD